MKLAIAVKSNTFMPEVDRLIPGAMLQYQNHVYIKVDTKKTGQDVYIKHPINCCVLLNPKWGSTRQIPNNIKVEVLGLCADQVEVYVIQDRTEMNDQLRW